MHEGGRRRAIPRGPGSRGTAAGRRGHLGTRAVPDGPAVRVEHYQDPDAPQATVVVPLVYAIVRNDDGDVLLVRRLDTGDWELPGGRVDPGESAVDALVREVEEEAGLVVDASGVAGIYTDPNHVVRSGTDGEVRQPFAICFHASARPGTPRPDLHETADARWWPVRDLDHLPMQPAVRRRLRDGLGAPGLVHVR